MSNPKGSLTKRVEKLEQDVAMVRDGAASSLGLEVVIEMLGREKFQEALLALNRKKQADAEAKMAEQVTLAVQSRAIQRAEEVGKDTIIVVGRGKQGLAEFRVHVTLPPDDAANRKRWKGKKPGDVVEESDGTSITVAEVYDVTRNQASPLEGER